MLQTRSGVAVADVPEPLASEFAGAAGPATPHSARRPALAVARGGVLVEALTVPKACVLCAGVAEHGIPAYAPVSLDVAPASDGAGVAVLFAPDFAGARESKRQRAVVWLAPDRRGVSVRAPNGARFNRKRWMKTHDSVRACSDPDADEWAVRAVLEVDLLGATQKEFAYGLTEAMYTYTVALAPHADLVVAHTGRRPVSEAMLLMRAHPLGATEILAATETVVLYLPMRVPDDEHSALSRCRRFVPTAQLPIPDTGIVWPISRNLNSQWGANPESANRLPHALMQFSPCGRWLLMLGGVAAERDDRNDLGLTLLDLGAWLVRVQEVGELADAGPLGIYHPELAHERHSDDARRQSARSESDQRFHRCRPTGTRGPARGSTCGARGASSGTPPRTAVPASGSSRRARLRLPLSGARPAPSASAPPRAAALA